ncbi:hypothetical protein BSKO_05642 [Bryopsis sp. KO-2023]|nr:hypothetical protein BSKO_05642 [Bryopsis sp. KO-2023]
MRAIAAVMMLCLAGSALDFAESGAAAVADVQIDSQEQANVDTDAVSVSVGGESTAEASGDAETQAKLRPICSGVQKQCCEGRLVNGDSCGRYVRANEGSVQGWKEKDSDSACRCN